MFLHAQHQNPRRDLKQKKKAKADAGGEEW